MGGAKIFISYRRDDVAGTCHLIYDRLTSMFGAGSVFWDVETIQLGEDYKAKIQNEVDQAAVVLVVIGPRWLNIAGPNGRRLDDPDDPVRMEIAAALERDLPIIPLLADGATFPAESSLPEVIKALHARDGMPIRNDAEFEYDMGRLIVAIRALPFPPDPNGESGGLGTSAAIHTRLIALHFEPSPAKDLPFWKPATCAVPAGTFLMGRRAGSKDESPEHEVALPAFDIGTFPVCVTEYACFVLDGHPAPAVPGMPWEDQRRRRALHPVVGVSWRQAVDYAVWLADTTGEGWRLPTEAEWERAACWDQGKHVSRTYPWGDEFDASRCNTDESGSRGTTQIDAFVRRGASAIGACDMAGNVWEWTSSVYKSYPYEVRDGRERASSPEPRVRRGGSWQSPPNNARCAKRAADPPDYRAGSIGFRLVRGPAVGA